MAATSLNRTQKYAVGALFAMAIHEAQIHQTCPLGSQEDSPERVSGSSSSSDSVSEDPDLWVHYNSGLLRPVFRFLEIDSSAWPGLEETAGASPSKHHIGAFLRLLSEDEGGISSNISDQEIALSKAVDATEKGMQTDSESSESKKEKLREYESECREKCCKGENQPHFENVNGMETDSKSSKSKEKHCEYESESCEKCSAAKQSHSENVDNMDSYSESSKSKKEKHCEWENVSCEKCSMAAQQSHSENVDNMDSKSGSSASKKEKHHEYERECHGKCSTADKQSSSKNAMLNLETQQDSRNDTICVEQKSQGSNCKFDEKPIEEVMTLRYERKLTVLYVLVSACLADTPEDKEKSIPLRKGYDARHRVALRRVAAWLDIKWIKMEAIETIVACSAMAVKKAEESKNAETKSNESKWAKWKRGGIIGAAAITGGALMAITGGLAAPAIAAGFGALAPTLGTIIPVIGASGFAAVASAAGSVAGSVAVAASFGAAGAGLTGSKMARRIGDVDEFEFKAVGENHNQGRLAVEVLVSGFVFNEDDFIRPWEGKIDNMERYVLQWESKNLIAVSTAIQDFVTSRLAMELMRQGAMLTVLSSLLVAFAWPATLVAAADLIDSKWTIAVNRSDKAGKLLAEVLLKGLQGNRPVTLIGYSLGARVIFKCLEALAENKNNAGIVERVVLLGAPISIKDQNWEAAREIVAGRFINAYSTDDWILGVAFRASLLTQGLAGIQPINVPGIENVDVTDLIEGHSSYLWATQKILEQLELDTYYPVFNSKLSKE